MDVRVWEAAVHAASPPRSSCPDSSRTRSSSSSMDFTLAGCASVPYPHDAALAVPGPPLAWPRLRAWLTGVLVIRPQYLLAGAPEQRPWLLHARSRRRRAAARRRREGPSRAVEKGKLFFSEHRKTGGR